MTDTRDDPRYIRVIGLTLVAALLVVASCQVEQVSITVDVEQVTPGASTGAPLPGEITIEIPPTREQIRRARISGSDEVPAGFRQLVDEYYRAFDESVVEQTPETTPAESVAEQMERVAELEAELEALLRELRADRQAEIDDAITIPQTRFRDIPVDDLPPRRTDVRGTDLSAAPTFTPMTVRPEITNRNEVIQALMREYPPILRDAGIGGTVEVWFFISETGQVLDSRVAFRSGYPQLDAAALRVARVFQFTPARNRDRIVPVWIRLPITFEVRN